MKPKLFPNGAYVYYEKLNGWHHLLLRKPGGEVQARIRCDNLQTAKKYFAEYCAKAETL